MAYMFRATLQQTKHNNGSRKACLRMKAIKCILFLFSTLIFSSAQAQDESVIFGDVELGKPLRVEKCLKKYDLYSSTKNNCIDDFNNLHFPTDERPKWLQWGRYANYSVEVKMFNDVVGAVEMTTSGSSVQNEVLQILTNKYGKPDLNQLSEKSNAYGAKMNSIEASWNKNNLLVYFSGVTAVNSGRITISTKEYIDYVKSKEVKKKEL
jgi:hypothetical protein